jgi:hypothetical protein
MPQYFVEPIINLATLLIRRKQKNSPDWAEEALRLLDEALRIVPDHKKAHYLRGRLLAGPPYERLEEAKRELSHDLDNSSSHYQLARLAFEKEKDSDSGFDHLRRSMRLESRVDIRWLYFVEQVLRELDEGVFREDLCKEAKDIAKNAVENATQDWVKQRANELLKKLQMLQPEAPKA